MTIYTETDTTVGTPGGFVPGTGGNDTYNLTSTDTLSQFHPWGGWGNDVFNLLFSGISGNAVDDNGVLVGVAHGHHVYGDLYSKPTFSDTFNFKDIHEVTGDGVVVGRLNDFDPSLGRDVIQIEGEVLDLTDLSAFNYSNVPSVASIRVVAYKGDHNDAGAQDQQWLLITTSTGGRIFYALEGARVDITGDGDSGGTQEHHFVSLSNDPATRDTFFNNLQDVSYQPTNHYVPAGYTAETGGVTYNDRDQSVVDVDDVIGDEADEATEFGDLIAGGLNDDTIYGQGGDDTVWGGSGHDTIDGGTGDDLIFGGTGNDEISGGADNDVLHGEDGSDQIYGGAGNDWLFGGSGNDTLYGAVGEDNLRGEDGNDTLRGHAGDDDLRGGTGEDVLYGNSDNDTLRGGADRDELYGGNGNDLLDGQTGHDRLDGGSGDDIMTGGSGRDVVVFDDNFGTDTITDFDFTANEVLDFSDHSGISSMTDLAITYVGSDTVITFGSDSVTLEGTTVILQVDDFIF